MRLTANSLLITLSERLDLDGVLFKGSLTRNASQLIFGLLQKDVASQRRSNKSYAAVSR